MAIFTQRYNQVKKIISIEDAVSLTGCVLTYGHFTVIHPGHLRYLKHAKSLGSTLVVAVIGDISSKDVQPYRFKQVERSSSVADLEFVDFVITLNGNDLVTAINKIKPKILVLGNEYESSSKNHIKLALEELKRQSGIIEFHSGDISYSNSELLFNSENIIEQHRRKQFSACLKRQHLSKSQLLDTLTSLTKAKLLVIGDTIVDRYLACDALGMSAEAPVIVVKELNTKNYIGGAAVVAAHLKALGTSVTYLSVVGDDSAGQFVKAELDSIGVNCNLVIDNSRPTTVKKRYLVENQKLFRVSRLSERKIDVKIEDQLIKFLNDSKLYYDGIIISDFVYGVLTTRIIDTIKQFSSKTKAKLFADLQCSTQIGNVTQYKYFDLLCPNEREARIATQDKDSGIESISQKVLSISHSKSLLMKLNSQGFILYTPDVNGDMIREAFPAMCANPVDTTGAGDSLLAVMAAGLSVGEDPMATAALGACMCALVVEKMGNNPVSQSELKSKIISFFD